MFHNKYISISLHVFLWLCYSILPVLENLQRTAQKTDPNYVAAYLNPAFWSYVTVSSIFLFYFNSELLIPKIFKKTPITYFIYLAIVMVVLMALRIFVRVEFVGDIYTTATFYLYFNAFIPYLLIFAVSASFRFFSDFQQEQKINREKENERLKSELSFLRSQISPHFMFNLLNSLVSLARKKSDLIEPVLLKMSDLLRYMLYERDDKKINLDREIQYLQNYVELQKMRFADYVKVDFEVGQYQANKAIEPMLLIPFIENAFKHGVGMIENPKIEIKLQNEGNMLNFVVINKYQAGKEEAKDNASGIGLQNIKRRLELLYPEKYSLEINQNNDKFESKLIIELNN
jgi:two-component system, LytTR family, sensor kinase